MLHKLPYGLRDGKLMFIEDVESGLKCKCICPSCKIPLIARKGMVNTHHFAHSNKHHCSKQYHKIDIEDYIKRKPELFIDSPAQFTDGSDLLLEHLFLQFELNSNTTTGTIQFTSFNKISESSPILISEFPINSRTGIISLEPLQKVLSHSKFNQDTYYFVGDYPYGITIKYLSNNKNDSMLFELKYRF